METNPILKTFYDNEMQREEVRRFIIKQLHVEAVDRVMKREDTSGLADAKEIVEQAFIKLKDLYSDAPKPSITNSR